MKISPIVFYCCSLGIDVYISAVRIDQEGKLIKTKICASEPYARDFSLTLHLKPETIINIKKKNV